MNFESTYREKQFGLKVTLRIAVMISEVSHNLRFRPKF
jgi:hypothetical protein